MPRSGSKKTITRFRLLLALGALAVMLTTIAAYQRELRDFVVDDTQYASQIRAAADKYRLDPQLVRAVIFQESRFRPDTIGTAGEVGLMQVLPKGAVTDWARRHGVAVPSVRELMRPELNLEIGCYYLSRAMKRWQDYRCRTELALCQYNAGESRANRWKPSQPDGDMIENITIAGTKTYVKNIMRRYQQYRRDEKP